MLNTGGRRRKGILCLPEAAGDARQPGDPSHVYQKDLGEINVRFSTRPGRAWHRTLAKTVVRGRSNTERQLRVSLAAFTRRSCDGTGGSAPKPHQGAARNPPSLHQPLELPSDSQADLVLPQQDPGHLHKPGSATLAPKQPRQKHRALPNPSPGSGAGCLLAPQPEPRRASAPRLCSAPGDAASPPACAEDAHMASPVPPLPSPSST